MSEDKDGTVVPLAAFRKRSRPAASTTSAGPSVQVGNQSVGLEGDQGDVISEILSHFAGDEDVPTPLKIMAQAMRISNLLAGLTRPSPSKVALHETNCATYTNDQILALLERATNSHIAQNPAYYTGLVNVAFRVKDEALEL